MLRPTAALWLSQFGRTSSQHPCLSLCWFPPGLELPGLELIGGLLEPCVPSTPQTGKQVSVLQKWGERDSATGHTSGAACA